MTAAVKGKTLAEAEALFERFQRLVTGQLGSRRRGNPGQARRVLRRVGIPGPGEVRHPAVARAEGGTGTLDPA